jgi:hypothetical protein
VSGPGRRGEPLADCYQVRAEERILSESALDGATQVLSGLGDVGKSQLAGERASQVD